MKDNNVTNLVIILDKSGSMHGTEDDVVGGYNALIDEQKKLDGKVNVTTILFDNEIETLYERRDIKDISHLNRSDYHPGGSTALLDTIGYAISNLDDEAEAEHTIISIMTDGYENASKEYTYESINKLIKEKETRGWQILFQGANIDVKKEVGKLGINVNNAMEFNRESIKCCMASISKSIEDIRSNKENHK